MEFTIAVRDPAGVRKGIDSILLNGKRIEGNLVPFDAALEKNNVVVVLGE